MPCICMYNMHMYNMYMYICMVYARLVARGGERPGGAGDCTLWVALGGALVVLAGTCCWEGSEHMWLASTWRPARAPSA